MLPPTMRAILGAVPAIRSVFCADTRTTTHFPLSYACTDGSLSTPRIPAITVAESTVGLRAQQWLGTPTPRMTHGEGRKEIRD